MRNYLKLGDHNAICDRCGFKFKASMLKKEWTGLMVCCDCWEMRHPQDLIRIPKEQITPPWSRPEPTDSFITWTLLTEAGDSLITESGDTLTTEMG